MSTTDWFQNWFESERIYQTEVEIWEGSIPSASLVRLLQLSDAKLNSFGQTLLTGEPPESIVSELKNIAKGFRAYLQFQDFFPLILEQEMSLENRNYCYYESLYYLREAIVCLLNGNALACLVLLRPCLELSIFQIYWSNNPNRKESYKDFVKWLNNEKGKPPFSQILNKSIKLMLERWHGNHRIAKLKEYLKHTYKWLCAFNHTPTAKESVAGTSGGLGQLSLESFYEAMFATSIVLRHLNYLYVAAYPLCLRPFDTIRTFGYSPPIGLFADKWNHDILLDYFGADNIASLKTQFNDEDILSLEKWASTIPSKTEQELELEWKDMLVQESLSGLEDTSNHLERFAQLKARVRLTSWVMAYINDGHIEREKLLELPEDLFETLLRDAVDW